ncbi:unnamed protein product [Symbiodinium microadriaticum]|nr:unnamed protein product [Symbiodinium microadriaticum]
MPTELFSRLKSRSRSGMWTSRSAGFGSATAPAQASCSPLLSRRLPTRSSALPKTIGLCKVQSAQSVRTLRHRRAPTNRPCHRASLSWLPSGPGRPWMRALHDLPSRARRVDSAAATTSMKIPDILAAGWSASFSGPDATIEMTKTSMPHPGVGALDTSTADFDEQTQYDVFCWACAQAHGEIGVSRWMTESSPEAHDDAVDGRGYARPNQQTEEYVPAAVSGLDDGLWLSRRSTTLR